MWLNTRDIYISLFRGFVFGAIIPLVCATQGYSTVGGAKNVGISTTKSAIKATVFLLMADLIITFVFYVA
jgi:phospholipid/cholesterol/gamma-HCH transport system permease protein